MTNNRIANGPPQFLYDSDDANRVVGIKQPNGFDNFMALSRQQPAGVQAAMQSFVASSAVAVALTNTTTETTLATITIPADAMGPNGWIEIDLAFTYTNSANLKTFRVRFGGVSVAAATATTTASFTGATRIQNSNDVAVQVTTPANLSGGTSSTTPTATTQNTAAAVALAIQGTMAALAETITLVRYSIRVFKQG